MSPGRIAAVKDRLRGTPVETGYRVLRDDVWRASRAYDVVLARRRAAIGRSWAAERGPGAPPPEVKQAVVLAEGRRRGLSTLVETGTYLGGTILAARRHFDRIFSIELDPELAQRARRFFRRARNVTVLEGDSAKLLPELAATIEEPALWWLDAHYSGPGTAFGETLTPIVSELAAIVAHPARGHAVLIDDARLFTGVDYPTLEEVRRLAEPRFELAVEDDIIRLAERR